MAVAFIVGMLTGELAVLLALSLAYAAGSHKNDKDKE